VYTPLVESLPAETSIYKKRPQGKKTKKKMKATHDLYSNNNNNNNNKTVSDPTK